MMLRILSFLLFFICSLMVPLPLPAAQTLMMATTTSTDNTGLLDVLAPKFEQDTGISLKWVSVGTGKALEIGRNCDVDVLLVHAPNAERQFVEHGYGADRTQVMFNDFILIGPANDPAAITGLPVTSAMTSIFNKKALFVSRGDASGTNKKERLLWKKSGLIPPEKVQWYLETGQGMLSTIRVAAERGGYTLTDRGTYITYAHHRADSPELKILVEGDPILFNQYSVIVINPDRCKNVQYDLARRFTKWITSEKIQDFIGSFKLQGQPLFTPNAEK